jgi:AsmA protein
VDLRAQAAGALRFNLGKAEFAFDKFSAQLKGRFDQDTISAEFSAPKVEVTPAKASGSEVKVSIQVKGPQRIVDARLLIAAVEGTASALTIPKVSLDLNAAVAGITAKAKLDAAIKANLAKQDLQADVSGRLDDSALKAMIQLTNFAPLKATFEASIDRLNVDRYLPPERKEAKPDERIDLAALKGRSVNGKIAIGALTARRIKLENVKADLKLEDGKLELAPHTANLYGGTLSGAIAADANGNRIHVKETAQNVAIGALLRDAAQKDMLEGRGNVNLDVQTAGGTVTALKKTLAGSARLEMKDGAIKGFNLADSARNVKSALGAKQTKPDPSQKTDFTEMSASFKIANGVAHNNDLKALSPFLRLGGEGNLDIGNNTIDYLAKATLAATARGQGGRDVGNVAGVTIPVKLTGALDNPQWNVDYTALLGAAGGTLGKAAGGATDTVKKGAGGLGDAVRGLFKR